MKKLYNKMINTMNSVSRKAVVPSTLWRFRPHRPEHTRGEGYIDTAVKI